MQSREVLILCAYEVPLSNSSTLNVALHMTLKSFQASRCNHLTTHYLKHTYKYSEKQLYFL